MAGIGIFAVTRNVEKIMIAAVLVLRDFERDEVRVAIRADTGEIVSRLALVGVVWMEFDALQNVGAAALKSGCSPCFVASSEAFFIAYIALVQRGGPWECFASSSEKKRGASSLGWRSSTFSPFKKSATTACTASAGKVS